mmetsp:Transcript_23391/g.65282  ORF Transcript_23391/g.65282 Transcript_23391/m.65282 type:complete len:80 (-) Transcript_23391:2058-2297(-)
MHACTSTQTYCSVIQCTILTALLTNKADKQIHPVLNSTPFYSTNACKLRIIPRSSVWLPRYYGRAREIRGCRNGSDLDG